MIARILAVMNEKRLANLAKYYAQTKIKPKRFRPRLTHKLRRALTPKQQALKTSRVFKNLKQYPARRFFIQ